MLENRYKLLLVNVCMFSKRRKGMELPINTLIILVMLLVLVVVVLILVSRGASNFTDIGEDKIGIAGDTSECEILCWECCHGDEQLDCGNPQFNVDLSACNCADNKPTEYGC